MKPLAATDKFLHVRDAIGIGQRKELFIKLLGWQSQTRHRPIDGGISGIIRKRCRFAVAYYRCGGIFCYLMASE
jgi:hypothetical protein